MSIFEQLQSNGDGEQTSGASLGNFRSVNLLATLPPQIVDQLCQSIVEECIEPGMQLKEVELSEPFGVSRATVREALRITENRGLVRIHAQRGAQVTLLSRSELENLFEIRAAMLGLAAKRVALICDQKIHAALKAGKAALAASAADPTEYFRASSEMVRKIAALSGNDQLSELIASFSMKIGRYSRLGLVNEKRRAASLASWKKLIQAIVAKDEASAERIFREQALTNRDAALAEVESRLKEKVAGEASGTVSKKPEVKSPFRHKPHKAGKLQS